MEIQTHEVHIWTASTDWTPEQLLQGYQILSPREREKADRYLVEHARRQHIASHVVLRQILSQYQNCFPDAIQFSYAQHGKPSLEPATGVEFNLSHSGQRAVIAVTRGQPLGVDIELHDPKVHVKDLAERFFAPAEAQELLEQESSSQLRAFYRLWVLKEAFIKGTGEGLSFGLSNFIVSLKPKNRDALLSIKGSVNLARHWTLGNILEDEQDYSAALAVQGSVSNIQFYRWPPQ